MTGQFELEKISKNNVERRASATLLWEERQMFLTAAGASRNCRYVIRNTRPMQLSQDRGEGDSQYLPLNVTGLT